MQVGYLIYGKFDEKNSSIIVTFISFRGFPHYFILYMLIGNTLDGSNE